MNTQPVARLTYQFNPECVCDVCLNAGTTDGLDSSGGSYCYGENHFPPRSARGVRVGRDCRIAPSAALGGPGFGYSRTRDGWERKPETHGVAIGDSVDIGANTCIDRGSYRDTTIGRGTKIDNLVHIAHNVQVGENCVIVAGAEVSGSVVIGDGAWIGPNACIREHLTVGSGALVGIGAVVIDDVPANVTVAGNPARIINAEVGVRDRM